MAPAVTAALIYSKEHLTLANKLRKPVVEKMRRDRINNSIEQLKCLLGEEFLSHNPDSKLEKADILEMTVSFLRRQWRQKPVPVSISSSSCSTAEAQGFSRCVQEIVRFLSRDEVNTQSQRRLLSHFQTLQPSSSMIKTESVLPQLNSPCCSSTSKEKTQVKSTIWRPW
uniref:Transcription factor HES-5 n=1 Tax=Scleropages formosus TaxID=113540 RepID=A0A8C9R3K4_SCLFO